MTAAEPIVIVASDRLLLLDIWGSKKLNIRNIAVIIPNTETKNTPCLSDETSSISKKIMAAMVVRFCLIDGIVPRLNSSKDK